MTVLRVAGAQIDLVIGDLAGNADRMEAAYKDALAADPDIVLFPELAISSYPPEDLLLKERFLEDCARAIGELAIRLGRHGAVPAVVGYPERRGELLHNTAAVLADGEIRATYRKRLLPNYGVFDEARYFDPGPSDGPLLAIDGVVCGISVCEDIWEADGPPFRQAQAGARALLNVNGSPYHRGKGEERRAMLADRARVADAPLYYLNLVGGQDELVFDGQSMAFGADGGVLAQAAQFEETILVVDLPLPPPRPVTLPVCEVRGADRDGPRAPLRDARTEPLDEVGEVYAALVLGLRDYVRKNAFPGVVLGLSGGIDSALAAALAADALGPGSVTGITMPSAYSSAGSVDDSAQLAANLGIRFERLPIKAPFEALLGTLEPIFDDLPPDTAEENLQARIRGMLLMAVSNKLGPMVLATGNKSEMATGYATLYGDMAGGFAVLKDVPKTLVWRLARWRNHAAEAGWRHPWLESLAAASGGLIPEAIIEKPPSAELRPDQLDSDSLPPYEELDAILERYVEGDATLADLIAEGFPAADAARVARLVERNEYKRRQAPPGVRISRKAFGKDRRLPITNHYSGA